MIPLQAGTTQALVLGPDTKWLLGAICFLVVSYGVFMAKKIFDHEEKFYTKREAAALEKTMLKEIDLILESQKDIIALNTKQTEILLNIEGPDRRRQRESRYPPRDEDKEDSA
jgi:hypothetical protein